MIGLVVEKNTENPISQLFEVQTQKNEFEILKKERIQVSLNFESIKMSSVFKKNLNCVIHIRGVSLENFRVFRSYSKIINLLGRVKFEPNLILFYLFYRI